MTEPHEVIDVLAGLVLERRRELGWSQERLAIEAGVSDATVRKIETGGSAHVQPGKLAAVRAALGLPVASAGPRRNFPPDIELARDLVGLWLQGVPEELRAGTVAHLMQWMYLEVPPPALPNPKPDSDTNGESAIKVHP